MAHKIDKMKLSDTQDRRRKLTDEEREEIKERYILGGETYRTLAAEFGVTHSMIGILVNPKRAAQVKQRISDNWRANYDKDEHRKSMRKTRKYKQELNQDGKLK